MNIIKTVKSRTLTITFPNTQIDDITPEYIVQDSMVIEKSLFDDDFRLGGCVSTMFECDLINVSKNQIQNKRIQAVLTTTYYTDEIIYPSANIHPSFSLYPGAKLEQTESKIMFTGTVDSANRTTNKRILHLVAYDDLYYWEKINVYGWFSSFAQYSPNSHLTQIVNTLIESQINDRQAEDIVVLKNIGAKNKYLISNLDYNLVKDDYSPSLYATDVLRSINELTLGFIYINEIGQLDSLQGLKKANQKSIDIYETLDYEDYVTSLIDIFRLTYQGNETIQWGRPSEKHSCYDADDNIIAISSTNREALSVGVGNLLIEGELSQTTYQYRPFECVTEDIEHKLGEYIRIPTMQDSELTQIDSYITRIRLEGIQSIKAIISATGAEIIGSYDSEYEGATS